MYIYIYIFNATFNRNVTLIACERMQLTCAEETKQIKNFSRFIRHLWEISIA